MDSLVNETRLPAAERIAGALLKRIEQGEYLPGEWFPTERELAAEFRADRSTIRAALSSLAENRLIVREPGRRSRVSLQHTENQSSAKQTSPISLQTLAILSPQTPHYPATPSLQWGALHVLRQSEAPYQLVVLNNSGETRAETYRHERQGLEVIRNEGIQGAIIWHQGNQETLPDLRRLQESGIPLVLVDRCPATFVCDFVGIDNREAAKEAVLYLLNLGHRKIGHLTMEDSTLTVQEREQGYREAMLSCGISPPEEWVVRMSHRASLQPPVLEAVDHFLALPEPPTAVFVMNDLLAHTFLAALKARDVRVPEQISVMGFDDMDRNAAHPSPLTTVHQPFEQMGRKAMDLLLKRLAISGDSPAVFHHVLLPTRLVIRSSCSPLSAR